MHPLRSWLTTRFKTFSLVPVYFGAIAKQWMNVLFGETLVAVIFLLWWALGSPPLVLIFVSAMFVAGYFAWQSEHLRLQQKIEVTQVRTHSWAHVGGRGIQYYFGIVNKSEAVTIHNVRVQLQEIIPEIENRDWFPLSLHIQHDNPPFGPMAQSLNLNPSEPRNIDLFATLTGSTVATIAHIVPGVDLNVPMTERRRLKVMVTAENIPVTFVWFVAWIDQGGVLQCEME